MSARIFTPARLAKEWDCSERHIRNLINRGELRHFRLGGKLLRIPAEAVEEFECQHTASDDSEESSLSSITTPQEGGTVTRLAPRTRARLTELRRHSSQN